MMQLVAALALESHHCNPLAALLLQRALQNTRRVGHALFWQLKAVIHVEHFRERVSLLIDAYIKGCEAGHLAELRAQVLVVRALGDVHAKICRMSPVPTLYDLLGPLKLPSSFVMPFDPRIVAEGPICIEKCRVGSGKRKPLWIVFQNGLTVRFKPHSQSATKMLANGMMYHLDRIWKSHQMDLDIIVPPACLVGEDYVLTMVVPEAQAIESIKEGYIFKKEDICDWYRESARQQRCRAVATTLLGIHLKYGQANFYGNGRDVIRKISRMIMDSQEQLEWEETSVVEAMSEIFSRSLAGWCVASYVLGIGGRDFGNVMLRPTGEIFYVDMGHFLGHSPLLGRMVRQREREPFLLTKPMRAFVFEDWRVWVERCQRAYNVLREHASLLASLLYLPAISTHFDSLNGTDISFHLPRSLHLEQSNVEAADIFEQLIKESLAHKTTQLSNFIHILVK